MKASDNDPDWPPYERRHDYLQGRIDVLSERRLQRMELKLEELDNKVDVMSTRLFLMIGGLAVISVILNLLGPPILQAVSRSVAP